MDDGDRKHYTPRLETGCASFAFVLVASLHVGFFSSIFPGIKTVAADCTAVWTDGLYFRLYVIICGVCYLAVLHPPVLVVWPLAAWSSEGRFDVFLVISAVEGRPNPGDVFFVDIVDVDAMAR